jgi:hypothetical protein
MATRLNWPNPLCGKHFLCDFDTALRLSFATIWLDFSTTSTMHQTALADLKAAPRPRHVGANQGRVDWPERQVYGVVETTRHLTKEEKPAAAKLINAAKVELEAALVAVKNSNSPPGAGQPTLRSGRRHASANCIRSHRHR